MTTDRPQVILRHLADILARPARMLATLCILLGGPLLPGAQAQSDNDARLLDSLTTQLQLARTDTDSLRIALDLMTLYQDSQMVDLGHMTLLLADRCGPRYPTLERRLLADKAEVLNTIASYYISISATDSATHYLMRALQFARKAGNADQGARSINNMGLLSYYKGDLEGTFRWMSKALAIRLAIRDTTNAVVSYTNMAVLYQLKGNIPMALDLYDKAIQLAERAKRPESLSHLLISMGSLHEYQKESDTAAAYYHRGIELLREEGNAEGLAHAYSLLSTTYDRLGRRGDALAAIDSGLVQARRGGHPMALSALLLDRSAMLSRSGAGLEVAERDCKAAMDIAERAHNMRNVAYGHEHMAQILRLKGDLRGALQHIRLSESAAGEYDELELKKDRAEEEATIHRALGDHKQALEQTLLFMQYKDSLANEENKKSVIRQGFKYEYQQREADLKAEQAERTALAAAEIERKALQRNAFIGGFGLMVLLAGTFFTQRNRISKARKRSDELLLNILPEEVAEELKDTGAAQAKHFDTATILFSDFKGFTGVSEKLSPEELVEELNTCFKAFDHIITARGIEKIKTIGDAYMCAGGLPDPKSSSPSDVVHAGLEMQAFMKTRKAERDAQGLPAFEMRVGIHTGPVVAGIVGVKKFQYDIWGDTVNIASRMESSGEVGQVNISEATYVLVKAELMVVGSSVAQASAQVSRDGRTDNHQPPPARAFTFTPRGKVQAKGKGEMQMYFVDRGSNVERPLPDT